MMTGIGEVRPGRRLHVAWLDRGSDTTLVFIHGGGGNLAQFRFQWSYFSTFPLNLLAWDAVGHGSSPPPKVAAAYAGAELLADGRAVLGKHAARRNIFIGHSYGARLLPGLLGLLPLPLLELARPILSEGFRRRAWAKGADPALVQAEQTATRGNSLFMMQSLLAGAPAIDEHALGRLNLPVVILAGDSDGLVPFAASEKLAALLPRAELRRVEHCGHQIMMEAPEYTNRAIEGVITVPVPVQP